MDVSAVCNSRIHYPHRTWDARKFKEREDGEWSLDVLNQLILKRLR
jgi:hypothetical protein